MLIDTCQVKEIMQKAFWDLLEQQLEADPPQYTQVNKPNPNVFWHYTVFLRPSPFSLRSRACSIAFSFHR